MVKKTITFVDYDGNERTEDFYFNFTKAEITEMELSVSGGLDKMIKQVIDSKDSKRIIEIFKDLVLKSYGVKSLDGRRFIKSNDLREEFSQTEAYSDIFMELATDADLASEFINGIIPNMQQGQKSIAPAN